MNGKLHRGLLLWTVNLLALLYGFYAAFFVTWHVNLPTNDEEPVGIDPNSAQLKLRHMQNPQLAAERPLFHQSRRPLQDKAAEVSVDDVVAPSAPAPAQPATVRPPSPTDLYVLRGCIISMRGKHALFEKKSDRGTIRVGQGDELNQWRLAEVANNHVVLQWEDERLETHLAVPSTAGLQAGSDPVDIVPR